MLKNNKGMTLIELLGALVISAILFSLLFGIFTMTTKSYRKDLTANDLQTDMNLTLTKITHQFYDHQGHPFDLHIQDGRLYFNHSGTSISSPSMDYTGSTFQWSGQTLTIHLMVKSKKDTQIPPMNLNTSLHYPWKESEQ